MMIRRLVASVLLLATLVAPALAQSPYPPGPPPPVPSLPDSQRQTTYTISGTTCACAVNFQLGGTGTDFENWVEVWLNGVNVAYNDSTYGWTITSPTGSLSTIPRPITDAVVTFNNAQTGTVLIVGAERPRRTAEFTEGTGPPARALNQAFNDLYAIDREVWDKINDTTGRALLSQPGNVMGMLPAPSLCENSLLGFGSNGLDPTCYANPLLSAIALLNGSTAVTQTTGDSSTKIATDQFVIANITADLSAALALANGSTATTQTTGDSSTKIATDQFVAADLAAAIPLANGSTAVTQSAGDNSTKVATDNFVSTIFAAPPAIGSTTPAAGKFTTLNASGGVTFSGLATPGTIAYSLCLSSTGVVYENSGVNCYPSGSAGAGGSNKDIQFNSSGVLSGSGGTFVYSSGNVGLGTGSPSSVDANSSVFLTVNNSTAAGSSEIAIGGNGTGANENLGRLDFFNSALGATDKRIALINAWDNGATNSGEMDFYTYNAGAAGQAMSMLPSGSVEINSFRGLADLRFFSALSCNPSSPSPTNVAAAAWAAVNTGGYSGVFIPVGCYWDNSQNSSVSSGAWTNNEVPANVKVEGENWTQSGVTASHATFTGVISAASGSSATLTVTGSSGTILAGDQVFGTNVPYYTMIASGSGPYTLRCSTGPSLTAPTTNCANVSSESMQSWGVLLVGGYNELNNLFTADAVCFGLNQVAYGGNPAMCPGVRRSWGGEAGAGAGSYPFEALSVASGNAVIPAFLGNASQSGWTDLPVVAANTTGGDAIFAQQFGTGTTANNIINMFSNGTQFGWFGTDGVAGYNDNATSEWLVSGGVTLITDNNYIASAGFYDFSTPSWRCATASGVVAYMEFIGGKVHFGSNGAAACGSAGEQLSGVLDNLVIGNSQYTSCNAGLTTDSSALIHCNVTSDERLKDINPEKQIAGLDVVADPADDPTIFYEWKKNSAFYDGGKPHQGFGAQHLLMIDPLCVTIEKYSEPDKPVVDRYALDTTCILATEWKAIRQLAGRVGAMESRQGRLQ